MTRKIHVKKHKRRTASGPTIVTDHNRTLTKSNSKLQKPPKLKTAQYPYGSFQPPYSAPPTPQPRARPTTPSVPFASQTQQRFKKAASRVSTTVTPERSEEYKMSKKEQKIKKQEYKSEKRRITAATREEARKQRALKMLKKAKARERKAERRSMSAQRTHVRKQQRLQKAADKAAEVRAVYSSKNLEET